PGRRRRGRALALAGAVAVALPVAARRTVRVRGLGLGLGPHEATDQVPRGAVVVWLLPLDRREPVEIFHEEVVPDNGRPFAAVAREATDAEQRLDARGRLIGQ